MLSKLLALLFPLTEKELAIEHVRSMSPQLSRKALTNGNSIVTCCRYDDPCVRAAISLLKLHGNPHATQLLATLLGDVLLEELADMQIWNNAHVYIVPIPISKRRRRERGFNQMERVCALLPKELRTLVRTDILTQTKYIPMQKTLSRAQRLVNVRGMFALLHSSSLANVHIIVVDDVTTTGATLTEATRMLSSTGATVTAVALARA